MTKASFYTWLIMTAMASLTLSFVSTSKAESSEIQTVIGILIFFFVFFTVSIYLFSQQAIRSTNPYMFTRVFLVSVMFKIMGLAFLVLASIKILSVKPKELIGPLISSYLLFTILETWILMKLSKSR